MSLYIKSFWITSSEQSPRATFLVKDIKPQQTELPAHYPLPFFLINRTSDSVQDSTVLSLKLLSQTPLQLALPFDSIRRKQQLVTSDYWENLLSGFKRSGFETKRMGATHLSGREKDPGHEDITEMVYPPCKLSLDSWNISHKSIILEYILEYHIRIPGISQNGWRMGDI